MPFIKIKGFEARVFVPDEAPIKRKHNCKDCFACQMCSDERCEVCLKSHCGNSGNNSTEDTECAK